MQKFFELVASRKIPVLEKLQTSESILFMDTFPTPVGFKLEKKIMGLTNLSRCYRVDSKVHDLMQLTDIIGIYTIYVF